MIVNSAAKVLLFFELCKTTEQNIQNKNGRAQALPFSSG